MINFHNLKLSDKHLFDRYFLATQHEISDFNFTNLFMWRKPYNVKYAIVDGFLCISAQYKATPPFCFFPLGSGDIKAVLQKLINHFQELGYPLMLRSLTPLLKQQLQSLMPGAFSIHASVDTYDYIYKSSDLISLEGKKLHAKRNHINRFIANNTFSYHAFTSELAKQCIKTANEWCAKRDCEDSASLAEEKDAIIEALSNFKSLKYKGGLIKVSDKIIAFTYGEKLTDNMAVIHVEKADPDIQGSYAMINQQFCEHEWQSVEFINREEDMGIQGLRKAKLSYNPIRMSEKYSAKLK